MTRRSAGILLYKRTRGGLRLLLVHPGGPFWRNKDLGAWSIPKGEYADGEDPLAAAQREFREELGDAVTGEVLPLGEIRQAGGKLVTAFAVEGDFDVAALRSNTFELQWPPKSGRMQTFPEVDRAAWFAPDEAHAKVLAAQWPFIERLMERLNVASSPRT